MRDCDDRADQKAKTRPKTEGCRRRRIVVLKVYPAFFERLMRRQTAFKAGAKGIGQVRR